MKKTILLANFFMFFLISCSIKTNQSKIIINITGYPDSTIVYLGDVDKQATIDSGIIIDNSVVFSVKTSSPRQFMFSVNEGDISEYCLFWKEDKQIKILAEKGNFLNAKVEGSQVQKQGDILNKRESNLYKSLDSLQNEFMNLHDGDEEKHKALLSKQDEIFNKITEERINYVKNNPDFFYSAFTLYFLMRNIPKEQTKEFFENLNPNVQTSEYGITVKKYLDLKQDIKIGDKAIDFNLADLDGNLIGLSKFKNKYILLEFWGSSCKPCRMENPNLFKNYKIYKEKGFEIISVSLDKNRDSWENAVKEDNMIWTTISDLKGIDGDVAIIYNIQYVPKNYFIDTNGVIIAEDLRGEELDTKLESLFQANQ